MFRKVAAIILFASLVGGTPQPPLALPASLPRVEAGLVAYLPMIVNQSPVKVVVTVLNNNPYGYSYYALGYVESAYAGTFEATLEADVTVYPFSIETPIPPYTTTVQFEPALDATLPGQHNPFKLGFWCYKGCTLVTAIRVAQAVPLGSERGAYLPLTIARWSYQDGALSGTGILTGTVRNESSQALDKARVVATDLDKCEWKEAVLNTANLQPGQETTFTIDPYYRGCISEQLLIVGQGHAP